MQNANVSSKRKFLYRPLYLVSFSFFLTGDTPSEELCTYVHYKYNLYYLVLVRRYLGLSLHHQERLLLLCFTIGILLASMIDVVVGEVKKKRANSRSQPASLQEKGTSFFRLFLSFSSCVFFFFSSPPEGKRRKTTTIGTASIDKVLQYCGSGTR